MGHSSGSMEGDSIAGGGHTGQGSVEKHYAELHGQSLFTIVYFSVHETDKIQLCNWCDNSQKYVTGFAHVSVFIEFQFNTFCLSR